MRRWIALLLALLLVCTMTACSEREISLVDQLSEHPKPEASEQMQEEQPTEAAPEEEQTESETPEQEYDDPTDHPVTEDYTVFDGVYRDLVPEEGDAGYVEITGCSEFILLEHFLCMEGSVYSYWAEEFWPHPYSDPNEEQPSVHGKSQTFSGMTVGMAYDGAPETRSITLTEEGIVLDMQADAAYYVREDAFCGHSGKEALRAQLGEDVIVDFEDLYDSEKVFGSWGWWDGREAVNLTFAEDGTFTMLRKVQGEPVGCYRGIFAFGAFSGNLEIRAERVGFGTLPAVFNWEWAVDESGCLILRDEENNLPQTGTEGLSLWPVQYAFFTAMEQQDALSYLRSSIEESGMYTDQYGTEYHYSYCLPQFYGDGDAVKEVNQKIRDLYDPIIEQEQAAMAQQEILSYTTVGWETECFEGVLYVHVYADTYDWEEHSAFYLDTATGAFLTTQQVLDRLLLDHDYFLRAVREAAEAYYTECFADMPQEDREEFGYYERLEWTLSDEVVNFDIPIFTDRWGNIAVYARIGSMAGSGVMWEVLYPFAGAVG